MKDWRITNQEKYMFGKELKKATFNQRNIDYDHEHCVFCWVKIFPGENAFCTLDNKNWVCEKCYQDFSDKFKLSEVN